MSGYAPVMIPVRHSLLDVNSLSDIVLPLFDVPWTGSYTLLRRGLNDSYLVQAGAAKFILRVYRCGWRSPGEILHELRALTHIRARGVQVAAPVRNRHGGYLCPLSAPEGLRYVALFSFAEGEQLSTTAEHASLYGAAAARVHDATADFQCQYPRQALDADVLLERPLRRLEWALRRHSTVWRELHRIGEDLRERLAWLSRSGLDTGYCHGDLNGGNARIRDGVVTLFDFDCSGHGWRAYDAAVFIWGQAFGGLTTEQTTEQWSAFLRGYESVRPLRQSDRTAAPLLVSVRHLWMVGMHLEQTDEWGNGWMDDGYFEEVLHFLSRARTLERAL
jgi:Ser/Thr protein kinase RdoA (MazF antagonist)